MSFRKKGASRRHMPRVTRHFPKFHLPYFKNTLLKVLQNFKQVIDKIYPTSGGNFILIAGRTMEISCLKQCLSFLSYLLGLHEQVGLLSSDRQCLGIFSLQSTANFFKGDMFPTFLYHCFQSFLHKAFIQHSLSESICNSPWDWTL